MTRLARHGTALAAVTFLLSSCATGGASTSVPTRFPTRVGANVQVIVTRRDYPVSGLTLRSLAESIRGSGVRDAGGVPRAALYGWQFRYTWTTR